MITIEDADEPSAILIRYTEEGERDQLAVMIEALQIYAERNAKYKDNWRRAGFRQPLYDLRKKVERLWDYLWNIELPRHPPGRRPEGMALDEDDALDAINFAAILVRAMRECDRDGVWW